MKNIWGSGAAAAAAAEVAVAVPKVTTLVVFVVAFWATVVVAAAVMVVVVDAVAVDGGVGYASSIGSCLTVIIFSIQVEVPWLRKREM